jgi:hypothetical protein
MDIGKIVREVEIVRPPERDPLVPSEPQPDVPVTAPEPAR